MAEDMTLISGPYQGSRVLRSMGAIAATSGSLLDRVSRLLLGSASNLRAADFVGGLDNLTVERDLALLQLGQTLKRLLTPREVEELDYTDLLALEETDDAGCELWCQLQTFQDAYGYAWADRYPRDPAWEVNREAFIVSLKHAA